MNGAEPALSVVALAHRLVGPYGIPEEVALARGVAVVETAPELLVVVGTGALSAGSVTSLVLQAVPTTAARTVARNARSRVAREAYVRARIMLEYP